MVEAQRELRPKSGNPVDELERDLAATLRILLPSRRRELRPRGRSGARSVSRLRWRPGPRVVFRRPQGESSGRIRCIIQHRRSRAQPKRLCALSVERAQVGAPVQHLRHMPGRIDHDRDASRSQGEYGVGAVEHCGTPELFGIT